MMKMFLACATTVAATSASRARSLMVASDNHSYCCTRKYLSCAKIGTPPKGGPTWHSRACTTSPRSPATRPRNVDFYARLLGLRLVKKTVNFDAPDVYHLYYGDEAGHARLDPDVLRVPGRDPGTRRRRDGPHDPVARRGAEAALGVLGRPPRRRRRRGRARRRRAALRGLRGPAPRAARRRRRRRAARRPRRRTSRPSTRCRASTACARTPAQPERSDGLLDALGFAAHGRDERAWRLGGDARHARARLGAAAARARAHERGDGPPHRLVGGRRRRAARLPRPRRRRAAPSRPTSSTASTSTRSTSASPTASSSSSRAATSGSRTTSRSSRSARR